MKIDRSKIKKGTSDIPKDCGSIISFLKTCTEEDLLKEIKDINVWYYGKCELFHWIDVLDRFDGILADIAKPVDGKKWIFEFDVLEYEGSGAMKRSLVFHILKFTALLIEHSYARHLYNSIEHLIALLDCIDGGIILSVLNLIFVFSKRSNYLSRLPTDKKKMLQEKLIDLAQTWGGQEAGYAIEQCCCKEMPIGAGNVYYEYYVSDQDSSQSSKKTTKGSSNRFCIDLKNVHHMSSNAGVIMEDLIESKHLPDHIQVSFYHRLRLAIAMSTYEHRLQFVQARLQALSILVYSNATPHINTLVYDGLIEEIVNTLKIQDEKFELADVKSSCLKTLTAIIHLDRNPKLQNIIDATEAVSYHGYLPSLVRKCILHMTDSEHETFPQHLATALFSFLYHLGSYESGCEALAASGLIESLLKVVLWPGQDDHITFVTRAVRVIDLITNVDMDAFQSHNGLNALVNRLEREVKLCMEFHGPALTPDLPGDDDNSENEDIEMKDVAGSSKGKQVKKQCLPQRAALLKSILNFLKKAIPDPAFADSTRSLMDERLQFSLRLIVSNAEYYGALLFLLVTDVISVFIFHEPSMLSTLQDSGLTWIVLKALIIKDVPATRENLASLPNTLSALCLNSRGLDAFMKCKPFERLFDILVNPEYLPAMKRRRSSDPQGDTAMHLGSAMDELMRHQPTLKTDAMNAIIKLLWKLCSLGSDKNIIAFHPTDKLRSSRPTKNESSTNLAHSSSTFSNNADSQSDGEIEEEFATDIISKSESKSCITEGVDLVQSSIHEKRKFVPVVDYMLNVMKLLDNILSNNGTDDHCKEYVRLGGLEPLFNLLDMANFPLEFPLMPACQSVSQVCKSIGMLTQSDQVFKEGLKQLDSAIDRLENLYTASETSSSALLKELAATENPLEALYDSEATPLVHAMSAVHAYVNVFVYICRGAQSDIRNMSVSQWGSDFGQAVLEKLCHLYTKLVWESSTLLTLCTPSPDEDISFAENDLRKLGVEHLQNNEGEVKTNNQLSLLKWLLTSSSHLGRALAEFFGLLVLQCVGSQNNRPRRHPNNINPSRPSPQAKKTAGILTKLLVQGLTWNCPSQITVPRLRLTFYICAVGFASPLLFDNSQYPYHLMLHHFERCGGISALFQRFNWVLDEYVNNKSISQIKTAVGISDFLDGWLDLISHLVNTKSAFDTTYTLAENSQDSFNIVHFVARIHMYAFESVMLLWKHDIIMNADNQNIASKVLTILCQIIKGEKLLQEKCLSQNNKLKSLKGEKSNDSTRSTSSGLLSAIQRTPAPTTFSSFQDDVNAAYLQQFVDMGFTTPHAREALIHSRNNFEVATEYLLTTPAPVSLSLGEGQPPETSTNTGNGTAEVSTETTNQTAFTGVSTQQQTMDVDISEDDMMLEAIALSLGQNEAEGSSGIAPNEISAKLPPKQTISTESNLGATKEMTVDYMEKFTETINSCTNEIPTGCLQLLDTVSSTVHTVCDLLLAVSNRNGVEWRNKMLNEIVMQIKQCITQILWKLDHESEITESLKILCESEEATKLSSRLHLFFLLFQDLENTCAYVLQQTDCPQLMVSLLERITIVLESLKTEGEINTPSVTAPLVLIFDSYEKAALMYRRKKNQKCSHIWQWFDDRSGRWCNYSVSNNTSIDAAYHAGESFVKFTAGRRRYMVFFKSLVQINEDTGNRRPIMLDVLSNDTSKEKTGKGNIESAKESELRKNAMERLSGSKAVKRKSETSSEKLQMDIEQKPDTPHLCEIHGLSNEHIQQIVGHTTNLLSIPVDPSSLNAALRIILRLTRDFSIACLFAQKQGVIHLLNLKDSSSFPGSISLISLLLRHLVEDEDTLKHAVERSVALSLNSGIPNMVCGVGPNTLGAKELQYLLRALGPIACRNPSLYKETILKLARLTLPSSRRGQLEETLPPNTAQIVKIPLESKTIGLNANLRPNSIMENFVHQLLNSLVERHFEDAETKNSSVEGDKKSAKVEAKKIKQSYTPQSTLVRRLTGEHIDEEDIANTSAANTIGESDDKPQTTTQETAPSSKYLMSESAILRLLTELAKSYVGVTHLIVNYNYTSRENMPTAIKIDGPILAFVFDHLLPYSENESQVTTSADIVKDKPNSVSSLARSLLSVIGAYWHNTTVQGVFVSELKAALSRAFLLSESRSKHTRLQALFNLITSMIETAAPISFTSTPPLQNINFIRMLIKKGIIGDLAKSIHHLDLSGKDLITTVNVMLKPLEKLTNLANSQNLQKNTPGKNISKSEQTSTTEDGSIGELNSQDAEGGSTDEILEQTNSHNNLEEGQEVHGLDDIMEAMLANTDGDSNILAETMITRQGNNNDGGIEERIYIEANVDRSSASSDADGNSNADSENMENDIIEGNEEVANVVLEIQERSQETETETQTSQDDGDGDIFSLSANEAIPTDSEGFRSFMETVVEDDDDDNDGEDNEDNIDDDHDDDTDDSDDEDDDDEDDDEGNDDDDEGSDMGDAMGPTETFIMGEAEEDEDDLDVLIPQHPYLRISHHSASDNNNTNPTSSHQAMASLLCHPLLLRNNGQQTSRAQSNQRVTRNRNAARLDRRVFRAQAIHGQILNPFTADDLLDSPLADATHGGEDLFFDLINDNTESSSGLINSVPNALSRWTFECRLLDGSSVHDCVNEIKPDVIRHLEKLQKEELQEKVAEEKKKKEAEKKKSEEKKEGQSESSGVTSTTTATVVTSSTTSSFETNTLSSEANTETTSAVASTNVPPITSLPWEMNTQASRTEVTSTLPWEVSAEINRAVTTSALPWEINTDASRAVSSNRQVVTTLWTPRQVERPSTQASSNLENTPSNIITPFNPLPALVPNAPPRELLNERESGTSSITSTETPSAGSFTANAIRETSSEMAQILGLPTTRPSAIDQTPIDIPRLNQFRENVAGLTAELGLGPLPSTEGNMSNTPNVMLPSVSQILATPAGIPSLQQLRSSSLFAQNTSPRVPRPLAAQLRGSSPYAPSPLAQADNNRVSMSAIASNTTITSGETAIPSNTTITSGEATVAADLAAAIMSQLVTSSPTPATGVTANTSEGMESTNIAENPTLETPMPSITSSATSMTTASHIQSTRDVSSSGMSATTTTTISHTVDMSESGPSSSVLRAAEQIQRELEGLGIPEGVDPSFLAALPDSIREEVLRDQFGIRIQTSTSSNVQQGTSSSSAQPSDEPQEVSPEFLAALPPDVQQEVLEQQRLEQARYVALQQPPEQPVDPAEFVRNLNPSLRRQVLSDMDDSLLALLPAELSSEAQGLRRENELRQLQRLTERDFTRTSNLTQLIRQSGYRSRHTGGGIHLARLYPGGQQMRAWKVTDASSAFGLPNKKFGRQLLDPEGLTCILVLLFLNDPSLNSSRLHRILRNLSYHSLTKQWLTYALISILRRSSTYQQESIASHKLTTGIENAPDHSSDENVPSTSKVSENQPQTNVSWLSRTLNLAFGGCVNIFKIQRMGRNPSDSFVSVHQQACLDVCKQTLEALSFLAKNFPSSFAPSVEEDSKKDDPQNDEHRTGSSHFDPDDENDHHSDFWDILVHLNASAASGSGYKGKALNRTLHEFPKIKSTSVFVTSPLGQILSMLSHPVIKQSSLLSDKLLRLLAVISMSLPERPKHLQAQNVKVLHESTPDARPPENDEMLPEMPHPIHTVTFADTENVLPSNVPTTETTEEDSIVTEPAGTTCSETTSVASSLYVEAPEFSQEQQMLSPVGMNTMRHDRATPSVFSGYSGGTVAQSDFSTGTTDQIATDRHLDSMDVDHPIRDTTSEFSNECRSSPALSCAPMSPGKEPSILIGQLRMAVNVLTGGICSDEGLEDATTLLLQLSRTEPLTRDSILELLLEGAQETANLLRDEISLLLIELRQYNLAHASDKTTADAGKVSKPTTSSIVINPVSARSQPWRSRTGNRNTGNQRRSFFSNASGNASSPFGASRRNLPKPVIFDLHLPTMATLTSKRASQSLFLRVLKVILQLREAARKSAKKPSSSSTANNSRLSGPARSRGLQLIQRLHDSRGGLREVVAALEADMEAMYEMIDRYENMNSSESTGRTSIGIREFVLPYRSISRRENQSGTGSSSGQSNNDTNAGTSSSKPDEDGKKPEEPIVIPQFPRISTQLHLDDLWNVLGSALTELAETSDTNAVLVLQPAVEAFFLVHGSETEEQDKPKERSQSSSDGVTGSSSAVSVDIPPSPNPPSPGYALSPSASKLTSDSSFFASLPSDTQKFLKFAETHRTVLNQILRQSTGPLSEGPFAVLVNHTRLLDFDVKKRYFRQELEKQDKGHRREDMSVHIRRDQVFEDSYRELHRRSAEEFKNRLYIVFDGEEGQDAGGLLREWYGIMAREMFNPNYALFSISQGEKATYLPNRNSHWNPNHLSYFKFAGRIVGKAIYDNKLLDCYFTRSFYKHILGKSVHYTDMEAEDYSFYQGLVYLLEHDINDLGYELTFSAEVPVFGTNEVHDLKPNGRNIPVTEETKREYVKLVCQEKMTRSIRQQIDSFLEGFYEMIPKRLISIFDEQELELLIAGLPTIDIEDLRANTEYHKYTESSLQIQWLWRALRSFEQADRAKFLQFVTGTSRVPLQGFAHLEGMNGTQKFQIHRDERSTDRLPCAHTCFNQLDLPAYETYDKLHTQLLKAIQECPEGFGLA